MSANEHIKIKSQQRKANKEQKEERYNKIKQRENNILGALTRKFEGKIEYTKSGIVEEVKFDALLRVVRSSRIDDLPESGFHRILKFDWVRPVEDWEPKGKSGNGQFYSLVEHLFCKYPVPRHFFDVFRKDSGHRWTFEKLAEIAVLLGRGGSFVDYAKSLTVPLTRKMCHEFVSCRKFSDVMSNLRWVQIKSYGGNEAFHKVWMTDNRCGSYFETKADEEFWASVMQWFCAQSMLDLSQVRPICDFLSFKHREDPGFSMKGRSVLAITRAMNEWHGTLNKTKVCKGIKFNRSGFKEGSYKIETNDLGMPLVERWSVHELLSDKELLDEGNYMHHCVWSYSYKIEKGTCSIWSLQSDRRRELTIEVDNASKTIVQARGRYNVPPGPICNKIMNKWAAENGLRFSSYL